jgi:hypothetical protein
MADFGPLGGVKVTGFISPTDTNDTYAVIDRRAGMIVGISGGTDYYKLNPSPWSFDMSDWTLLDFTGGGGSTTLSGLTDTTITAPTTGDTLTYVNNTWVNLSTVNFYFTASVDGQTYFVSQLPTQPSIPSMTECWINGQKQRYGVSNDFVLSGATNRDFVWVSSNFDLNTTDEINVKYK